MASPKEVNLLPETILKNIESIISLQSKQSENTPFHQRTIEKIAVGFGEPTFLYFQIAFFLIWGCVSYFNPTALILWNLPDLDFKQDWIGITSLLISTAVLVSQTRDGKLSEERSLLMLQINLLTEQKIAKLIALIEELRTDLPDVHNRQDLEAELMKQATDPQIVLEILQEALEQANIETQVEKSQTLNTKNENPS
jgi:uncharacterized membrane protein